MITHIKTIIFFILILGCQLNAKEQNYPLYNKYVNEIVNDFTKDMKSKYNLYCDGSGGSMPNDVEKIEVSFISYQHSTVENARKLEVNCIQSLLQLINNHEKIRPFLREYPFKSDRVDIMIAFENELGGYPLDGSVALVFLAKNKIFYRAAEIQMIDPTPYYHTNEKKEVVTDFIGGGPSEELIPLHEETFEEAMKIVGSSSCEKKD